MLAKQPEIWLANKFSPQKLPTTAPMICPQSLLRHRYLAIAAIIAISSNQIIAGPGSGISSIAEREIARRMARMEDARIAIENGDKKYAEGDYEAALGEYKAALDALPVAPMTKEWRDLASAKYADCSVALARERAKNGRYPEARELLNGALAINADHQAAKEFLNELDDPDRWPRALTPEHVTRVQEVQRGLELANSSAQLGNYNDANEQFQDVLRKDGYNTAARRGMELVEQRKSEYYGAARDHTRAKMLNDVNEAWEIKVPVQGLDVQQTYGTQSSGGRYLKEKMDNIIFPSVSFSGATIEEAVEFLRLKSRDLDTQERNPEKKGVNIIVRTGDQPVTSQITLDLKEVPMSEALRYITELAGMKYKVEPFAVLVVPISDIGQEMYTEIYRVPPDFLSAEDGGGGAAAPAPSDPFAAGGAAPAAGLQRRKTAKQVLEEAGIPFPDGASANFIASSSQLVVRNTRPNLDAVQLMVEERNKNVTKQVHIQTKFVEVSQKNTDELGFDWLLGPFNLPGSERVFGSGGNEGNSANGPINSVDFPVRFPGTDAPAVGQNPLTRANRSGSAAISPDSIDGLIAAPNVVSSLAPGALAFAGVFTDPQFQVVIRALSQKKGVDLMSAPSVTTKSGEEANVEVSREFIYPTEFDPPEIPQNFGATGGTTTAFTGFGSSGSTSSFPVTPTTPTAFEMRPVGVKLIANPTVGPDGYTIDLNLSPEVTEFEGFINYGSPIQTGANDALGNPTTITLTENKIEQPVFSTRKLKTSVTIWDGQTVAMGGLIREDVQDVEDKVPILGDIPILGRLFQTKAEDHFKRNLMIFVTAHLIDPSGQRLIKPGTKPGDNSAQATAGGAQGPNPLLPPVQ